MGCAWILGCVIFGLLVVKNSVECRIARQYLCQTAMFMCGLAMLALTTIDGNYQAYLLFVWIYGEFGGSWVDAGKLTDLSSRRNFRRRIPLFAQNVHIREGPSEELCSRMGLRPVLSGELINLSRLSHGNYRLQALPIAFGVPLAGYINLHSAGHCGYYLCAACSIIGSLTLFLVDLHKRNVSKHKDGTAK